MVGWFVLASMPADMLDDWLDGCLFGWSTCIEGIGVGECTERGDPHTHSNQQKKNQKKTDDKKEN